MACLEKHIIQVKAEGKVPLMVNATASTTVYGAFDPINEMADICEKYSIWLHVDVSDILSYYVLLSFLINLPSWFTS